MFGIGQHAHLWVPQLGWHVPVGPPDDAPLEDPLDEPLDDPPLDDELLLDDAPPELLDAPLELLEEPEPPASPLEVPPELDEPVEPPDDDVLELPDDDPLDVPDELPLAPLDETDEPEEAPAPLLLLEAPADPESAPPKPPPPVVVPLHAATSDATTAPQMYERPTMATAYLSDEACDADPPQA